MKTKLLLTTIAAILIAGCETIEHRPAEQTQPAEQAQSSGYNSGAVQALSASMMQAGLLYGNRNRYQPPQPIYQPLQIRQPVNCTRTYWGYTCR